ncbi:hypothetical protein BO99DRAFT_414023 [Aspergillus violaceofuscus CBS 115571]|uniref:Uncharacterized protein n=1 Tax=Aspergillus violaceofuscus (strain CBS 115571) TaxID=1450538 RepID=A0A2V5I0S2_ASPV1|nr:hypothetical protein BO99DRAFT_414023 [Aspergillus violaceofuscus CBS 115571]
MLLAAVPSRPTREHHKIQQQQAVGGITFSGVCRHNGGTGRAAADWLAHFLIAPKDDPSTFALGPRCLVHETVRVHGGSKTDRPDSSHPWAGGPFLLILLLRAPAAAAAAAAAAARVLALAATNFLLITTSTTLTLTLLPFFFSVFPAHFFSSLLHFQL